MSYLLTEIALEMLGYKFYDIYGFQDEINNFQNHANADRTSEQNNSSETNLSSLLGMNTATSAGAADWERRRNQEMFEEVNGNLPDALTKLMDTEYNKVRQQVLRNKPTATETHSDPKAAQAMAQNFVEAEHRKLRLEIQNLRNFRKVVEQNLLQRNPTTFERYCQIFKPARKQLKRLNNNKPLNN